MRASRNPRVKGVIVRPLRRDLETINSMIEAGELTPVIDSQFTFADSEDAYMRSRSGRAQGKIIITVADDVPEAGAEATGS